LGSVVPGIVDWPRPTCNMWLSPPPSMWTGLSPSSTSAHGRRRAPLASRHWRLPASCPLGRRPCKTPTHFPGTAPWLHGRCTCKPCISIFYYQNNSRRTLALETSPYEPILMLGVRQQYPKAIQILLIKICFLLFYSPSIPTLFLTLSILFVGTGTAVWSILISIPKDFSCHLRAWRNPSIVFGIRDCAPLGEV
jgi:hypothetical protein